MYQLTLLSINQLILLNVLKKVWFVYLCLGLRGPPLDENLLLSNIATANKKVKHLSEVGHHIVIKSVTGLLFNPNDCLAPAWQHHLMK